MRGIFYHWKLIRLGGNVFLHHFPNIKSFSDNFFWERTKKPTTTNALILHSNAQICLSFISFSLSPDRLEFSASFAYAQMNRIYATWLSLSLCLCLGSRKQHLTRFAYPVDAKTLSRANTHSNFSHSVLYSHAHPLPLSLSRQHAHVCVTFLSLLILLLLLLLRDLGKFSKPPFEGAAVSRISLI